MKNLIKLRESLLKNLLYLKFSKKKLRNQFLFFRYFLLETNKPIIVSTEPMVPMRVIFSFKKIAAKKIVITGIK